MQQLAEDVLGQASEALFPAWVQAQREVLEATGPGAPTAALLAADISAARWVDQPEIDWIMLTPSLAVPHQTTTFISPSPPLYILFWLLWPRAHQGDPSLARFLQTCFSAELPTGWMKPPPATDAPGPPLADSGRRG